MTEVETKLSNLFDELVPAQGPADSVAGEVVRAINRIGYRFMNDGDQIGIGYGKETCNPAARYLIHIAKLYKDEQLEMEVEFAWEVYDEYVYADKLEALEAKVIDFLEAHPELKEVKNEDDMHEHATDEDVDDDDMDDDEDECEDEYEGWWEE